MKPILFNTEMVRAILEERKTVTRRVVKPQPDEKHTYPLGYITDSTDRKTVGYFGFGVDEYGGSIQYAKPPYKPGDVLYVRETWCSSFEGEKYFYLADKNTNREEKRLLDYGDSKWHPSIHMPKEAARIFLKVVSVRVERLQDITEEQAVKEGCKADSMEYTGAVWGQEDYDEWTAKEDFSYLWNSTIKPSDINTLGWDANPYVWVIEFERCEKPTE